MVADRRAIDYRPTELVAAILGHIYDTDHPVPWLELVDHHTNDRWPWKTVENVIYDLIAFGAIHKIGKATKGKPDERALKPTQLGRAWLNQQLEPLPNERPAT